VIATPALRSMLARHAVLLPHSVSSHPDIPILELTPPHPAKNNSPHFRCLREPILQPLSFQIHPRMGDAPPSFLMGSIPSEFPHLALSPLPATLMTFPASAAIKRLTARTKSFTCNTYTKQGRGMVNHRPLGFDVQTSPSAPPVLNRTDDSTPPHIYNRCAILPSLRSGDRPFLPPWRPS